MKLLIFKPLLQFAVIIRDALVPIIIKKQAKRQAVSFPVFYHTGTAFFVIRAGRFRAGAFFYVSTSHYVISS
jgi:hypothetical protein